MKKLVLAAFISLASLAASAQVTFYGLVREYVDSTKVGSTTVTSMVDDTSRIGMRASENLGNGLTARVRIETGFNANNPINSPPTQYGSRRSTIGLATKNGTVDFGLNTNSFFDTIDANDVFRTDYGSIAGDIHNVRTVRSGDAVFATYAMGPVKASFDRTLTGGNEATTYSASGNLGPVLATVAHFDQGNARSNVVAGQGSYLGAKITLIHSADSDVTGNSNGTTVGAAYKLALLPVTLKTSYGVKTGDVRAFALGAEYAMSKRTSVNVALRNVDAVVDTRQIGVGLSHSF